MTSNFNIYDTLGTLVPGVLFPTWVVVCFPTLAGLNLGVSLPEAFEVMVLTALAILVGQFIQALASISEPVLFWTWGGRPSDRALREGLKGFLPGESAARIKAKLTSVVGPSAEDHSLFLFAMQRSDASARVARFIALYAYHRALLILTLASVCVFAVSLWYGASAFWPAQKKWITGIVLGLFLITAWYRTRQRACYFVREVLLTAERVLDEQASKKE